MPAKTETKTIDGLEVTTTQFPAMQAVGLFARLARVDGGQNIGKISPDELQSLIADCLRSTTVTMRPAGGQARLVPLTSQADIDAVFSGSFATLIKTWGWVVDINFGTFKQGARETADVVAPSPTANP